MTAPTIDDTWALVARAQAGDTDAFADLYSRYRDTVYRYVWFRVGHKATAEEISQDVWVRALKRLGSVEYIGRDLGAWLVTIARNLVADHFKSSKYLREVTTSEVGFNETVDDDWYLSPSRAAADYLESRQLLAAVQRLIPDQREVLTLRFLCGLSTEETAAAMGRNLGAIKALQYRATNALRRDPEVQALAVSS